MNYEKDIEWDEDHTAMVAIDPEASIVVCRGVIGKGMWYRDPCTNEECDVPECRAGGNFAVISMLMTDIEGNDITLVIPLESQMGVVLTDLDTIKSIRDD